MGTVNPAGGAFKVLITPRFGWLLKTKLVLFNLFNCSVCGLVTRAFWPSRHFQGIFKAFLKHFQGIFKAIEGIFEGILKGF